ncbi:MAG TPA: type III-A CRISPR-associated RAMP protein Csm4 [Ignavibacteriaceae bacterium]|nr:type III-A CRISPR-associated RAMP protein Csm4 [Ignavibacteriaceae bacterium]
MKYLFELNFKSSIHIGSDYAGYGIEDIQGFAHSDTIFSGLINVLISSRHKYHYDWLNSFIESNPEQKELPFKVSSFGFVKHIDTYRYFLPKPFYIPSGLIPRNNHIYWKNFKNLHYISLERYLDIIKSFQLDLENIFENEKDDFWVEQTRDQIQTDVITASTNIYSSSEAFYKKNVKPFILVELNEAQFPILEFVECLKLLGKYGIGGRKTIGSGNFNLDDEDWFCIDRENIEEVTKINPKFNVEKNSGRVLLKEILEFNGNTRYLFSTLFPEEITESDLVNYNLIPRRGWIFSTSSYMQLKRKTCYMFSEGSILKKEIKGKLVDVTPEAFTDHKVWRYGIPFYLPYINLE